LFEGNSPPRGANTELWKIEAQAVQGTSAPQATEPRIPATGQSTACKYIGADPVAKLFDLNLPNLKNMIYFKHLRMKGKTPEVIVDRISVNC
jgi:hypothetical protein